MRKVKISFKSFPIISAIHDELMSCHYHHHPTVFPIKMWLVYESRLKMRKLHNKIGQSYYQHNLGCN